MEPARIAAQLPLLKDDPASVARRDALDAKVESLPSTLDLQAEIARLKSERNAVILAHFYQDCEIQDLADHLGDSLQLAFAAKRADNPIIVFAGVHFMAETAKILNPDRVVLVPDLDAGCSLADGCKAEDLARFRDQHPNHLVVSYINCTAATKALSDIIVTSSNAVAIVNSLPKERPVLFLPDRNLGAWVAKKTGRDLTLWQGACIVHEQYGDREILALKEQHQAAGRVEIIAHPECEPTVLRHADFIGSTTALLNYAKTSTANVLIVATEVGILHQMTKVRPDITLVAAPSEDPKCSCNYCPHMKRNSLEKLYLCLRDLEPQIDLPADLMDQARVPIERMLAASAN